LNIANNPNPQTFEEAKFSSRLCLAFLLYAGKLDFANFTADVLGIDDLRLLMERIEISADASMTARFPKERPARVEVTLKNGEVLVRERSYRRGDPEQPWQWPELIERFVALTPQLEASSRKVIIDWCAACGQTSGTLGSLKKLFANLVN
jgi:2-methylcitrate dehydratase PrpD